MTSCVHDWRHRTDLSTGERFIFRCALCPAWGWAPGLWRTKPKRLVPGFVRAFDKPPPWFPKGRKTTTQKESTP